MGGYLTLALGSSHGVAFVCGANGNDVRVTIRGDVGNLVTAHTETVVARLCSSTNDRRGKYSSAGGINQ